MSEPANKILRKKGVKALSEVLNNEKNITIIEKAIFKNSSKETYTDCIFQIINDIISKIKLSEILDNIKNKKTDWEHPSFDQFKKIQKEQDDYLENPIEVVEGVMECNNPKCGSKKVFYFQKQTRSCDEGTSVFAECSKCGKKWVCSG